MIVDCPACGQKLTVREGWLGKRLACPRCQAPFEVPRMEIEDQPELVEIEDDDDEDSGGTYAINPEDARLPDAMSNQKSAFGPRGALALDRDADLARCLALHAASRRGLAGCGDIIFVLDLSAGKQPRRFHKQRAEVSCLAISPDGQLVLSGDAEGGLLLWDLPSRQTVRWFEGHSEAVQSVAFSLNGRYAVSGGDDGATRLWELETGKEYALCQARWDQSVSCVAFSPDGRQVLAAGGKVRTWSVQSGEPRVRFQGGGGVESAAFSRDGSEIVACAPSATSRTGLRVRRWEAATGKPLACFEDATRNGASVHQAVVVPGSLQIVSTGRKRDIPRGPLLDETTAAVLSVLGTLALSAVLMPAGGYGYIIFQPGVSAFEPSDPYCLQTWSLRSGMVQTRHAGKARALTLAVSADGTQALSADRDNRVYLWDLPP